MKKIFKTLVVLFAMLCSGATFACSQNPVGSITGGACSIAELNNLENNKTVKERINLLPQVGRDLRPIQRNSQITKIYENCNFGTCFYRIFYEGGRDLGK